MVSSFLLINRCKKIWVDWTIFWPTNREFKFYNIYFDKYSHRKNKRLQWNWKIAKYSPNFCKHSREQFAKCCFRGKVGVILKRWFVICKIFAILFPDYELLSISLCTIYSTIKLNYLFITFAFCIKQTSLKQTCKKYIWYFLKKKLNKHY
jgi:hypothetical protein